jgi:hypothetical protein
MPDELIISADSHMTEPPNLWVERIDTPFRERAPRVVREQGADNFMWASDYPHTLATWPHSRGDRAGFQGAAGRR